MSSFEILNEALITYSRVVRDNFSAKADSIDFLSIISNTSNELKDMINGKVDIAQLSSLITENSNGFMNISQDVNNRVLTSVYDHANVQSNIRFNNIESTKANILDSQLTGITNVKTLRSVGDIYTEGTLVASNLRILGDTSIVNTITTVTDQLSVINDGTDAALILKQSGNANIAEFYNSAELLTVIDRYGRIGINTLPRYDLDVSGTSYSTYILGDSANTTVSGVYIKDIFASNLNLIDKNTSIINTLSEYVTYNFEIIESNIRIITNTINYGRDQLLNMTGTTSEYPTILDKVNSLEARILYLEQKQ
jgi:hypothetical protein